MTPADWQRQRTGGASGLAAPKGLAGGEIIAKVQPPPAGEQAHADVGARSTTPGRSRTRATSSTPKNRIVPETNAASPPIARRTNGRSNACRHRGTCNASSAYSGISSAS